MGERGKYCGKKSPASEKGPIFHVDTKGRRTRGNGKKKGPRNIFGGRGQAFLREKRGKKNFQVEPLKKKKESNQSTGFTPPGEEALVGSKKKVCRFRVK